MRAVVQRVKSASVSVQGTVISRIGRGLVCFIGLKNGDTMEDVDVMVRKVLNARIFASEDPSSNWKHSILDVDGEILCVSNFTLYGRWKKSSPDFSKSMPSAEARDMYAVFLQQVANQMKDASKVKDGEFGAMMDVALLNDGPVTLTIDSDGTVGITT